jgi:hypothetical protein
MSGTVTIDNAVEAGSGKPGTKVAAVAIEDSHDNGPSDADAIREAHEALQQTTAQLTAAQQRERAATTEASRARDEAARMAHGRAADHRAVLAQAVEGADSDLARARIALRSAGEAGDWEALAAAQEAIGSATYRKSNAAAQLAGLGDPASAGGRMTPPAPGQQQQQQTAVPGPRSRQWLSEHPRMDTDRNYQAAAVMAHNQALERGFAPETDQYFDLINRVMDAAYGPAHAAGTSSNGERPMAGNNGNGGGSSSHAGASNRGGGGGGQGGFKAVRTGGGVLEVSDNGRGGPMRIKLPQGDVLEFMEEGAKTCFPDEWMKNQQEALATYMGEQVKIAREIEAGSNGGMIQMGEGRTYR